MKTESISSVLAASLLLHAYAASAADHDKKCPDVQLRIDKHTLDMKEHKPACVTSPGSFVIRLKLEQGVDLEAGDISVNVKPEYAEKGEISIGSIDLNQPQPKITVLVSPGFSKDSTPGYEIVVKGVGNLDPRVRVSNNRSLLSNTSLGAQEYAELETHLIQTFGVTTLSIVEIERFLEKNQLSAAMLVDYADQEDPVGTN